MRIPFILVALGCASPAWADTSWQYYGGDAGGRRFSPHTQIDTENVSTLQQAWVYRTGDVSGGRKYPGTTSFKATPVLYNDTLYLSTPFNRVIALNAGTGEERWTFDPAVRFSSGYAEMYTSRGVSLWVGQEPTATCGARVILGTLDARLIALDATTGVRCEEFGDAGEVDLSVGIDNYRRGEYSVTSPPAIVGDLIVVGSAVGDNGGVELDHGNIRAFDVRSGQMRWDWDPIPRDASLPGYDTWSREGAARTGSANAWSVISADASRKLVFVPTTSPSPDFYGGVRKGHNLYANSVVAIDTETGVPAWHFQTVHHDLWDYDVASQPMLTRIRRDEELTDVVVQATKMGHIFILDRVTGEPVFPVEERPVPSSDIPGEETAPTQPFPVSPPPLHPARADRNDIWDLTPEHEAFCRGLFDQYRNEGMFTPPSLEGTVVYPGNPGGVNWGSMAVHEERQIALVINKRWPTIVTLVPRADFRKRARSASNDPLNPQYTSQSGTPYGMKRHGFFNPENGAPCLKGPWGTLVAIDLASGDIRWEVPTGVMPGFEAHPEASTWGTIPSGGPVVTRSGVIFAAMDDEPAMYAYDLDDGRVLHRFELPASAQATPMSYESGGRQFVVITAGGETPATGKPGDYVLGFALEN